MKAIYLETFAGISGNMLLGALLDAGFPIDVLKQELFCTLSCTSTLDPQQTTKSLSR